MFRILFVSIAFPPKSDPEALQAGKYFHYLKKYEDLEIDVVTSDIPTLYMPYDSDLNSYAKGIKQLISIPLYENRYFNYIINYVGLSNQFFPDVKHTFHRQSEKVLKILKHKPDLIYSRSEPKSSTIMAYKLKQQFDVPWILHMSDPWADCPIHNMKGKEFEQHAAWEFRCFEAADIISLTSIPTISFYKKKYKEFADKFRLYPNVFDDELETVESGNKAIKNKFRIVHTGGMSGTRSPEFFLKPLQALYRLRPEISDQMEVFFAGSVDSKNRDVFRQYNLPFVKRVGVVSYSESLRLQRSADYLLAIDNPIDDPLLSMFFPSKLLDYMLARKRILVITTKGSASDVVMRDLKGDVFSHEEEEKIMAAISNALRAYETGEQENVFNQILPRKYSASYNACRLHNEFRKLLNV